MKKGILTKTEEKLWGRVIVSAFNFKGILKMIATVIAPLLLRIPDDKWGDKIPQPWQSYIEQLTSMISKAYADNVISTAEREEILLYCARIINTKIDMKVGSQQNQILVFYTTMQWIAGLLTKVVNRI
jgi:hypothetical protein